MSPPLWAGRIGGAVCGVLSEPLKSSEIATVSSASAGKEAGEAQQVSAVVGWDTAPVVTE